MTYTVIVTFVVDERTDEHLLTADAVRDEVQSWLDSLNASDVEVSIEEKV